VYTGGYSERRNCKFCIMRYMHGTGLSEELALEHVRNLIDENRKKLNKERLDDFLLANPFIETAFNFDRQVHCADQSTGDGHSS
jgi:hypothetical protein